MGSASSCTSSGMMASNAGPKNAVPAPYSPASTIRCHRCNAPVSESTPIPAMAAHRTASATTITRRRSSRSLITPPTSTNTTCGIVMARPTSASAAGAFDSA